MASILLRSLVMLIGLSMALTSLADSQVHHAYPRRISRNKEYQRRLGQIAEKMIDASANDEGANQQPPPQGTSVIGAPTRYMEELACLEACYKCVEDSPATAVSTPMFASR